MARGTSKARPRGGRKRGKAGTKSRAKTSSRAKSGSSARKAKAPEPGRCPLTGLPAGEAARRALREEVEAGLTDGRPLSLALVDVDGFARHNEELGVKRADELLGALWERFAASLDADEEAAQAVRVRLAGDLFGLAFPGLAVEGALSRLEEARRAAVEGTHRVGRGVRRREVEPTLSVGLAGLHRDAKGFRALLHEAQEALYRAKALGGNRVGLPDKARMVLKTSYYPPGQLDQLKQLAKRRGVKESALLREALGDLFLKYKGRRPEEQAE